MAITSKTNENPSKTNGFPKLMKFKNQVNPNESFIVLFTDFTTGVVVFSTYNSWKVGCHHRKWAEEYFKDYDGEVVLKNV